MILPDLNILIYAYHPGSVYHAQAKQWWHEAVNSGRSIGLPWVVILGFIRLTTNKAVMAQPCSITEATSRVAEWLSQPNITVLNPGPEHPAILFKVLEEYGAAGNFTTDAHLAALAIEYRAELITRDNGFAQVSKLRFSSPF
jgi:uncharacterized protein